MSPSVHQEILTHFLDTKSWNMIKLEETNTPQLHQGAFSYHLVSASENENTQVRAVQVRAARWELSRWELSRWELSRWEHPRWELPRWELPRWDLPGETCQVRPAQVRAARWDLPGESCPGESCQVRAAQVRACASISLSLAVCWTLSPL